MRLSEYLQRLADNILEMSRRGRSAHLRELRTRKVALHRILTTEHPYLLQGIQPPPIIPLLDAKRVDKQRCLKRVLGLECKRECEIHRIRCAIQQHVKERQR